tara:strand:- start:182 stop:382 length:201 start_codon:yes stop_codon:yes gene_type:complete
MNKNNLYFYDPYRNTKSELKKLRKDISDIVDRMEAADAEYLYECNDTFMGGFIEELRKAIGVGKDD